MTATETTNSVVDALERAPRIVIPMVRQAPVAILKRRPAPHKWSVHEHACHLAVAHGVYFARLDAMLTDDNPVIRSYDPGRDDPDERLLLMDLDESIVRYVRDREALVVRLRRLNEAEWRKTARHDEYNSYSVFTMFRHLALHDLFHAYRIEELLLKADWPAPDDPFDMSAVPPGSREC